MTNISTEQNSSENTESIQFTQMKKLLILAFAYFLETHQSAFRIRLNFEKIIQRRYDDEIPGVLLILQKLDFSLTDFEAFEYHLDRLINLQEQIIELYIPYLSHELNKQEHSFLTTGFYWLLFSGKTPYKLVGNTHIENAEYLLSKNSLKGSLKSILIQFTKNLSPRPLARTLAVQGVYAHLINKDVTTEIDPQIESFNSLLFQKVDQNYYRKLMYGAVSNATHLIERFSKYLDRSIDETTLIEISILVVGCHELINFLDVPYKVIINEYVELAKRHSGGEGYKFVNSVLDRITQECRLEEFKQNPPKSMQK